MFFVLVVGIVGRGEESFPSANLFISSVNKPFLESLLYLELIPKHPGALNPHPSN